MAETMLLLLGAVADVLLEFDVEEARFVWEK